MTHELKKTTLTATDGSPVEILEGCAGLATGYARVVNGWLEGLEYFDKYSDGDTCVEAQADEPGAMPVADAYQEIHRRYRDEIATYEADLPLEDRTSTAIDEILATQDVYPLTYNPFATVFARV